MLQSTNKHSLHIVDFDLMGILAHICPFQFVTDFRSRHFIWVLREPDIRKLAGQCFKFYELQYSDKHPISKINRGKLMKYHYFKVQDAWTGEQSRLLDSSHASSRKVNEPSESEWALRKCHFQFNTFQFANIWPTTKLDSEGWIELTIFIY